jgi:hypothetical protein
MTEPTILDPDAAFASLVTKTKATLKKHPNMSAADVMIGFTIPMLEDIRKDHKETREAVEDLWDYIGELPEGPLLEEVEQMFLGLSGFLDQVLLRAGWLAQTGPTDLFPRDMRDQFIALARQLGETQERVAKARVLAEGGDDEDEDEDDDDDDGDDADGETIEVTAPETPTTGTPEA